ncbi:uncharacterized protein [Clytia hemisphaerica]|uniref:uncharacterized protein isoform X2 n=1 Tax=Clytia hemisphaerica TaxID=252671 RepID=UPI0034D4B54D
MSKRIRSTMSKTLEQKSILQKYYDQGMTSYGKDHYEAKQMVLKAVEETGLSEKQVKDWINNQNKPPKVSKTEKIYTKKPRGCDLFKRKYFENLKGTVYDPKIAMKKANEKWGQLSDIEKKSYEEEAASIVVAGFDDLPVEEQKARINEIRKKMNIMCQELESYGVEILVMDYDLNDERAMKEGVNSFGSNRSADFLEANDRLEWRFAQFMDGVLKIGRTTVPYKAIADGIVEVHGLPEGFQFRNPTLLSKSELTTIKDNIDNISFVFPKPSCQTEDLTESNAVNETLHVNKSISQQSENGENLFDERMEDVCKRLLPDDYVPNSTNHRITLRQLIEKDEKGEGYVEEIRDHDETGAFYLVKWIGYKEPTWTKGEGIPSVDLKPYKERANII